MTDRCSGGAVIVVIAGGSGSGKTTLARAVCAALAPTGAALISEDDYYHCASTIPGFDPARHDFDALAAKDMGLLGDHLFALRRGDEIEKPRYNFSLHQREPQTERLRPPVKNVSDPRTLSSALAFVIV